MPEQLAESRLGTIFHQRLKDATGTAHCRLETQLPLLDSGLTVSRYRDVLRTFLGFYVPLESCLDTCHIPALPVDLACRRKSWWVMTLLKNGKLWGLISCLHHHGPKHVAYEHRTAAEFLAHLISLAMASKEELEDREYLGHLKDLHAAMMKQMLQHVNFQEGLLRHETNLLSYFGATGAVVAVDSHLHKLGTMPDDSHLRGLVTWLENHMGQDTYATDRLSVAYPPAEAFRERASGLLALRLFVHKPHFILWFLPEVVKTVHWAGDPRKPVDVSRVNGEERLMPRTSFALWKESVRGTSRPWRESELTAAADLRRAIVDVVLRNAGELARANEELTRSNVELDAFAYIASHDLKEPLRGIQNYARFVMEDYEDKLDEEGKKKLRTMMKLTERMDELIDGLLHYSRLSRAELERERTDVASLVRRVVQSLNPRLEELHVGVRVVGTLPTLSVNPVMFQEVFANLITNAMKYNDKPDKWIEIGIPTEATASQRAAEALKEGMTVLSVKDNGIGIPGDRQEQIFEIFRRLHARDAYGGGTGVGLRSALGRIGTDRWFHLLHCPAILETAVRLQPDCILLDLRLSEESGYEVLFALMEQDRVPKIPVIMLTGATWNALEACARSLGASGYLVKGKIDALELDRAIRSAILRVMSPVLTERDGTGHHIEIR